MEVAEEMPARRRNAFGELIIRPWRMKAVIRQILHASADFALAQGRLDPTLRGSPSTGHGRLGLPFTQRDSGDY